MMLRKILIGIILTIFLLPTNVQAQKIKNVSKQREFKILNNRNNNFSFSVDYLSYEDRNCLFPMLNFERNIVKYKNLLLSAEIGYGHIKPIDGPNSKYFWKWESGAKILEGKLKMYYAFDKLHLSFFSVSWAKNFRDYPFYSTQFGYKELYFGWLTVTGQVGILFQKENANPIVLDYYYKGFFRAGLSIGCQF